MLFLVQDIGAILLLQNEDTITFVVYFWYHDI